VLTRTSVVFLLLIGLLAAPGCVYYNTFYHARTAAREAEELRVARPPDSDPTSREKELLDRVVQKSGRVLRQHPDSGWADDALLLMGTALYHQGKYESAESRLSEFLTTYQDSELRSEAEYTLAAVMLAKGNPVSAESLLEEVAHSDPPSPFSDDALVLIGEARNARKLYAEAAAAYDEALERFPRSDRRAEIHFLAAENHYEAGKVEKAATHFAAAADERGARTLLFEARIRLAEVVMDAGRTDEAFGVLDDLERRTVERDDLDRILLLKGRLYEVVGDFDEAISTYEGVAASHERSEASAEAHYRIGLIHRDHHESLDDATESFSKSRDEAPRSDAGKLAAEAAKDIETLRRYVEVIEEHEARLAAAPAQEAADDASGEPAPSDTSASGEPAPSDTSAPGEPAPSDTSAPGEPAPSDTSAPGAGAAADSTASEGGTPVAGAESASDSTASGPERPDRNVAAAADSTAKVGESADWATEVGADTTRAGGPRRDLGLPPGADRLPGTAREEGGRTDELGREAVEARRAMREALLERRRAGAQADSLGAQQFLSQLPGTAPSVPEGERPVSWDAAGRDTEGGSEDAVAEARFGLAELYLFAMEKDDKALEQYLIVARKHRTNANAPRAALAVAWILETRRGDVDAALDAYRAVIWDFPETEQADAARTALETHGAEWMEPERVEPEPVELVGPPAPEPTADAAASESAPAESPEPASDETPSESAPAESPEPAVDAPPESAPTESPEPAADETPPESAPAESPGPPPMRRRPRASPRSCPSPPQTRRRPRASPRSCPSPPQTRRCPRARPRNRPSPLPTRLPRARPRSRPNRPHSRTPNHRPPSPRTRTQLSPEPERRPAA